MTSEPTTTIIFELHGTNETIGNVLEHEIDNEYLATHEYHSLGDDHAVFTAGFVTDLIENHDDDDDGPLIIPLPAFIQRDAFVQFCNHLVHYQSASNIVGFGKHSELSYKRVNDNHSGYISWAETQDDPSPEMRALLEWVASINAVREVWSNDQEKSILRIAKYFLVDLCSSCGIMSTDAEQARLSPCHRTRWPNNPIIPVYTEVVQDLDEDDHVGRLAAWRKAWDTAEEQARANGTTVCTNDDLRCLSCIENSTGTCRSCNSWECRRCESDTESPILLKRWHEEDPRWYDDEYILDILRETTDDEEVELGETNEGIQIRDDPPYRKLQAQPCLRCRKRVCHGCGKTCSECNRRACNNCKNADNLNSFCKECRHVGEEDEDEDEDEDANVEYRGEEDDDALARHIVRNEWICRPCFDRQPHECRCGNPSYDPNALESESDEDNYDNLSNYDEEESFEDSEAEAEAEADRIREAMAEADNYWEDDAFAARYDDNRW